MGTIQKEYNGASKVLVMFYFLWNGDFMGSHVIFINKTVEISFVFSLELLII